MPVAIKGSGGGSVTLDAGAAAADTTLTLPNTSGTLLQSGTAVTVAQGGTGVTSTGSAGNVLFTTDGSTWSATQKIVQGTAQASSSGTSIDFIGIPSWVKRVTVMLSGVSTNGSSNIQIQVGSGSFATSSYYGYCMVVEGTSTGTALSGAGLLIDASVLSSFVRFGQAIISSQGSNIWAYSSSLGIYGSTGGRLNLGGGNTGGALSGALDRIRITTVNGTDTFTGGSINIMYE